MKTLLLSLALLLLGSACVAQNPDGSIDFQCGDVVWQAFVLSPFGPPTIYEFALAGGTFVTHRPYCQGNPYSWHSGPRTDDGTPGDYSQGATFGPGGVMNFLDTKDVTGFCNVAPYCHFYGHWVWAVLEHQVNSNGTFTETFRGELVGTLTDVAHPKGAKAHAYYSQPTVASVYPFNPNDDHPETNGPGVLNVVVGL